MKFLFRKKCKKSGLGKSQPAALPAPVEEAASTIEGESPVDALVAELTESGASVGLETPAPEPDRGEYLTLQLADFLPHLPSYMLKMEGVDPWTPLLFDMAGIAKCLYHGQSTIPLTEIVRRVPSAFHGKVVLEEPVEIQFPWRKVMKLLDEAAATAGEDGAETLVMKLRRRHDETRNALAATLAPEPAGGPRTARDRETIWFTRKIPTAPVAPAAAAAAFRKVVATADQAKPKPSGETHEGSPNAVIAPSPAPPAPATVPCPAESTESPGASHESTALLEELGRARDAALLRLERLRGDHEREMIALRREKQLAIEAADHRFARLQTDCATELAAVLTSLEAELPNLHTLKPATGESPCPDDNSQVSEGEPIETTVKTMPETSGGSYAEEIGGLKAKFAMLKSLLAEVATHKQAEIVALQEQCAALQAERAGEPGCSPDQPVADEHPHEVESELCASTPTELVVLG